MANPLPPIPTLPISEVFNWRQWFTTVQQNMSAGANGTFISADNKTITVANGIITSII